MCTNKAQSYTWQINDVSILFPLPEKADQHELIKASEALPTKIINLFPRLSIRYDQELLIKQLAVVSIRLDPDKRQVKFVWQPLIQSSSQNTTTIDAAFHSFYQLTADEFSNLLGDLSDFFSQNPLRLNAALHIHPVFNGTDHTNKTKKLSSIFKKYCHEKNIVKVTAMVVRGGDDMWAFMGFDINDNVINPMKIVNTNNSQVQTFINQAVPFDHFDSVQISPLIPPSTDAFNNSFLGLTFNLKKNIPLSEEEITKTVNHIFKIENPNLTKTDAIDCVSCHVAQPYKNYLQQSNTFDFHLHHENKYTNPRHNLDNITTSPLNTRNLRGFGYFGNDISISQRVINESAEVVDFLNRIQIQNLSNLTFLIRK